MAVGIIFRNRMKKWCQHIKNAVKLMSDTSKCHQRSVAYMKMSSKWCRIHGSSRPRKPPVAIIHIFAMICEVQLGGHGADRRGKDWTRAEKHDQNRLDLGCFEVQKVRCFFKSALGRSSKLCFLCGRGPHFQKNREKKLSESEKWSQKRLDGKYDGYMRGLDGAEKRKR